VQRLAPCTQQCKVVVQCARSGLLLSLSSCLSFSRCLHILQILGCISQLCPAGLPDTTGLQGRRMGRHLPPSCRTPQLPRRTCRSTKVHNRCLSGPAALHTEHGHCGLKSPVQHQHDLIRCAVQNCARQMRQWAASAKKAIARQCQTWSAQLEPAAALAVTFNGRVLVGIDGQWPSIKLEGWVQSDPSNSNTQMCFVEFSTHPPYVQGMDSGNIVEPSQGCSTAAGGRLCHQFTCVLRRRGQGLTSSSACMSQACASGPRMCTASCHGLLRVALACSAHAGAGQTHVVPFEQLTLSSGALPFMPHPHACRMQWSRLLAGAGW